MSLEKWFLAAIVSLNSMGTATAQIRVMPQKDTTLQDAKDGRFKVGDVWAYSTREGEEESTLTILKVESSPELGVIVHIAVERVRLANCHDGPSPDSVPHMPFARRALNDSVTKKIASNGRCQITGMHTTSGEKRTHKRRPVSTAQV
jgi:hypothetical protein